MNKPFDCVVLSTNLDPLYWPFFHLVSAAWRKLFDVPVHLAVVGEPGRQPEFAHAFESVRPDDIVHWIAPFKGVPEANQAKLARYFLAANLGAETKVLLHDIDFLPLCAWQITELLAHRQPGEILAIGSEYYTGPEKGKFMAAPLLTESQVLADLFSPTHLGWVAFVNGLKGTRVFDRKEDPMNSIDHEDPGTFSDESLLRALLAQRSIQIRRQPWHERDRVIDRSGWSFEEDKLQHGHYAGAHLLRPFSEHWPRIHPLAEYLGIT